MQVEIEAFRPEMPTSLTLDQARRDPHPSTDPADGPVDNVLRVEAMGDGPHIVPPIATGQS